MIYFLFFTDYLPVLQATIKISQLILATHTRLPAGRNRMVRYIYIRTISVTIFTASYRHYRSALIHQRPSHVVLSVLPPLRPIDQ